MASIRAPATEKTTTLTVAVKCRPLTERKCGRDIVRVQNDKVCQISIHSEKNKIDGGDEKLQEVVVFDPDLSKDYLDRIQNRTKERRYAFDYAFGPNSTNLDVYQRSIHSTIFGVVQGLNATVFAYGSTGSGKTYTMVGTQDDPGLMVLSLNTIFDLIEKDNTSDDFEVTCSYLEVYNEVIYDLLEKSSGHLELREDPEKGIIVAGLRSIKVNSAVKILELLNLGNNRRKTESTEVNETSSRSHAVLEINVTRKQQKRYPTQFIRGKLALVDLAGSERASETNSGGQKLRDGANINRSLLALANCINALGKQQKKGLAYVPYRNSKLTRILKDGLSGNSQTIMIATISPADHQYHHTVNTLKYAGRAKEIKTHIQKNIGTINAHVSDYQKMIDNLQGEVIRLRKELAEKEIQLNAKPTERDTDDEISWLNALSQETSENVQDRINLQKALIELDETNIRNRKELRHLDDAIAKQQAVENEGAVVQALQARRQVILDNIRDNDELGVIYQKEVKLNEKRRCQLQDMIDEAIKNNGNKTYLGILGQYRLLGIANTELQFEMAMRDQIISSQKEAQRHLWNLLMSLGLDEKQIVELGAKQGIIVEEGTKMKLLGLSNMTTPLDLQRKNYYPLHRSPSHSQCGALTCFYPQTSELISRSLSRDNQKLPPDFCLEDHPSSFCCISRGFSPSAYQPWHSDQPILGFGAFDQHSDGLHNLFPHMRSYISPYDERGVSTSSFEVNFRQQQQQDGWAVANKQEVNMNDHVDTSSAWDRRRSVITHCGGTMQATFGHLPTNQVAITANSPLVLPKLPTPNQQNVSPMLPSHVTSNFHEKRF